MRVAGVQANQQTFGTKVKINKHLKTNFARKDGGAAMNEYVKMLENNGNNDSFVIAYQKNPRNQISMHADVLKFKGTRLFVGRSVHNPTDGECPNLAKLYLEASQNMHPFF